MRVVRCQQQRSFTATKKKNEFNKARGWNINAGRPVINKTKDKSNSRVRCCATCFGSMSNLSGCHKVPGPIECKKRRDCNSSNICYPGITLQQTYNSQCWRLERYIIRCQGIFSWRYYSLIGNIYNREIFVRSWMQQLTHAIPQSPTVLTTATFVSSLQIFWKMFNAAGIWTYRQMNETGNSVVDGIIKRETANALLRCESFIKICLIGGNWLRDHVFVVFGIWWETGLEDNRGTMACRWCTNPHLLFPSKFGCYLQIEFFQLNAGILIS